MILCMGCEAPNGHAHICRGYSRGKKCQCCKCHPHEEPKSQTRFDFEQDEPRAELRLRVSPRKRPVANCGHANTDARDDEAIFVRAEAIIEKSLSRITNEDRGILSAVVVRARRAARQHPNSEIEVSPYVAARLGLEE